jgi:hypothetical protein
MAEITRTELLHVLNTMHDYYVDKADWNKGRYNAYAELIFRAQARAIKQLIFLYDTNNGVDPND